MRRSARLAGGMGAIVLALSACSDPSSSPTARRTPGARASNSASPVTLETFYGPERFQRDAGAPNRYTRTISTAHFEAPFVLHVRNGNGSGAGAVTSGSVSLDGRELIGTNDFKKANGEWALSVTPGATATLDVSLASAPGSYVDVWLEGHRSAVLFCPDGARGAFTNLSAAIAASPDNGTVVVCDGEHIVDTAHVTRPVTIRSEHPHGATLLNADQGTLPLQQGRASITINNVPNGLVRIVDLAFRPRYRGITAQGTYDQVLLDSITIIGDDNAAPIGWEGFASTVPTASVEIRNSHFEKLTLGLFPVAPVEHYMHHNTFDNFTGGGGALYFSGGAADHTYSFGRAEYNQFRHCGVSGCIRAVVAGNITIAHNTLDLTDGAPRTPAAIVVIRSSDAPNPTPMVIEDNEITGAAPTGDPNVAASWSTPVGIQLTDNPGVADVLRRNRITNAHTGVQIGGDIDMQDNSVTNASFAFRQTANRSATVRRNDFTGLVNSFQTVNPPGTANYQCNYWGTTSGPRNVQGFVQGAWYAPWSDVAIANSPSVQCDPAATPMVVRVCPTPSPNFPTVPTFIQAHSIVAANGEVRFCDGTFTVSGAGVTRPMTITAEGPGTPLIDRGGASTSFAVNHIASGAAVTISKLHFVGTTTDNAIVVNNNMSGSLTISQNQFDIGYTTNNIKLSGVNVNANGSNGGTVVIENNQFAGGDLAINSGTLPNGTLTIRNNTMSNLSSAGINISPNLTSAAVTIRGNTFDNCIDPAKGFNCIFVGAPGTVIDQNTFTAHVARQLSNFVFVNVSSAGSPVVVSGNTMTGADLGSGPRQNQFTYPLTNAAIGLGGGALTVSGNHISGAYQGIAVSSGAGALTITNNTVSTVWSPVSASFGNSPPASNVITANSNDFTDYIQPIGNPDKMTVGSMNARCNWWGAVAGPQGMSVLVPATVYTPWAIAAVANGAGGACTGGLP